MEQLRKFWPYSFNTKEVKPLVIKAVIYTVIMIAWGVLAGLLSGVKVLGVILWLLGTVIWAYCTAGIAFTFLNFFKVGKFKDCDAPKADEAKEEVKEEVKAE